MLTAAFIDWAGAGLLRACAAVFLVQTVGITAKEVGVALTTATIAGFVMSFPISRLADRWSARRALVALNVWRGLMFLAYAFFVHDFVSFLVVAVLIEAAELSLGPVINTLMTDLGGELDRIRYLAYFRTVVNVGITAGGLAAAVALTFPTRATFSGLLALAAAACLVAAAVVLRVPDRSAPHKAHRTTTRLPFTLVHRILRFSLMDGVLALYLVVLNVALPVWIVQHTAAPAQSVALLYALNTVLCVLLQVSAARLVGSLASTARTFFGSGALLALAAAIIGSAARFEAASHAVAVLALGVVLLTIGELLHSSAGSKVSYALADKTALTRSFATYNLGRVVVRIIGPMIVTFIVIERGQVGWLFLGAAFLVAGLGMSLATRVLGREEAQSRL